MIAPRGICACCCGASTIGKLVIELIQSNRLEVLAAQLAQALMQATDDAPLQPVIVLVPHPGMARWLRRWLAEHIGICANIDFVLPAVFAWRVLAARLSPAPRESVYAREVLVWRIVQLLPTLLDRAEFAPLQRYLAGDNNSTRLYPLAARLADTYDKYLVYRGDWLLAWEKGRLLDLGEDEIWQQKLWIALVQQVSEPHRAALFQRLLQQPASLQLDSDFVLPTVIHGFGLSQLAPVHLDVLRWLSAARDVRLYQLNYSLHYWGDLTAERDLARYRARWMQLGLPDRSAYHDVGHPLLASWGKPGRDFLQRLHNDETLQETDAFELMPGDSLLTRLQRSLLLLEPEQCTPLPNATDRSLQIHACANRLREVEALHDVLLDAFSENLSLMPRDVVVMVPRIDDYASAISAVFVSQPASRQIPFRIADRALLAEHVVLQGFRALLDLPQWRFSASEVLGFLSQTPVMRCFDISEQEKVSLAQWIEAAGIRWGLDASFRADLGVGDFSEHTWREGLDRLLAGYALGDDIDVWRGVAPIADIEGQYVQALGKLATLLQSLQQLRERLTHPQTMAQWQQLLLAALDDFFLPATDDSEAVEALTGLRAALGALATNAERALLDQPIAFAAMREALDEQLAEPGSFSRFPGDGVTFCTLVPLRAVPFRVVALLGMNDGEFPRIATPNSFDLMRQHVRLGDRNTRDDDRYLFLEALLAARDRVHLSYIDRRAEDGQPRPPSALIDELLEFFRGVVEADASEDRMQKVHAALLRRHPLHPFAREYFSAANVLQSFADEWLPAARSEPIAAPMPRFADNRSSYAEADAPVAITLADLQRFFSHPARVQLHDRLGIDLYDDSAEIQDDETFVLDGLGGYNARVAMLELSLKHGSLPETLPDSLRLAGLFPAGPTAGSVYAAHRESLNDLAKELRHFSLNSDPDAQKTAVLDIAGFTLDMTWNSAHGAGLLNHRVGGLRARDHLSAWLMHLVLSAVNAYAVDAKPVYFGIKKARIEAATFARLSVPEAIEILRVLIDIYRRSFAELLPLFPESQYAFAVAQRKAKDAHAAAIESWYGNEHQRGEYLDAHVALLARGREPLIDAEFETLAQTIFMPLLDCSTASDET
ncbi:exodeoxyribonuclease V subunit gamma [Pseudolysobacter antarcticus]|nr:exodeoxyribonuclease V subunit gamma [Pseudolysobacter antarcticus]